MTSYSVLYRLEDAHNESIWSCAWRRSEHDGSENIITGSLDEALHLYRWEGDKLIRKHKMEGCSLGVVSVDINSIGTIACSSSMDAKIRIWDMEKGSMLKAIEAKPVDVWTIHFTPDSKYIISSSHTGHINLWSTNTSELFKKLPTNGKFLLSIAVSSDGKYVAGGTIDGWLYLYDLATGDLVAKTEAHALPIRVVAFSADVLLILTGSDDNHVKLFDVSNLDNCVSSISAHSNWVLSADFSIDNRHFLTSSADKTIKVWDGGMRQCINTFNEHTDQVWSVKYNNFGTRIVSVSDDRSVNVLGVPTG